MSDTDVAATLVSLTSLRHRLTELELRIAHQADTRDLGPDAGATDTASWWANRTRQTKRLATHRMALAQALDGEHEAVKEAMAAGLVSEEQAVVIVKVVEALPSHREEAETHLIGLAGQLDPIQLKRCADRVLEVIAPEIAEEHERKALDRQDSLAEETCRFTMSDDGHGTTHLRGRVPTPVAAMLRKALLANNAPRHLRHTGTPKGLGHAFCEYVTRYPIDRLARSGGVSARVVVTMTLDQLLDRSDAPATLDTGDPIASARQGSSPARPGSSRWSWADVPGLSMSAATRPLTAAQRIAMGSIRDKACTAEGCDWPPALCHAHHDVPWSRGGKTDIADGRLLCPRHHSYAHNPKYEMKTVPNGRVVFSRS